MLYILFYIILQCAAKSQTIISQLVERYSTEDHSRENNYREIKLAIHHSFAV